MFRVRRVLLADDRGRLHRAFLDAVERTAWVTISVCLGAEVLSKALETMPDVIVVDMSFPDLGGREVLAQLKADRRTARLPVFAWSAHERGDDRDVSLELGADDYLEKPPTELLVAKIEQVLSRTDEAAAKAPGRRRMRTAAATSSAGRA